MSDASIETVGADTTKHWYVLRDLSRPNAKRPAYVQLQEKGLRVFVPMKGVLVQRGSRKIRIMKPVLTDLVFLQAERRQADELVQLMSLLQYRWVRSTYREPMVVSDNEMNRFIAAIEGSIDTRYFMPGEITPAMVGKEVKIVGGPLDGYEGKLLSARGTRSRRLLVEIKNLLSVAVEVNPEYITFKKE